MVRHHLLRTGEGIASRLRYRLPWRPRLSWQPEARQVTGRGHPWSGRYAVSCPERRRQDDTCSEWRGSWDVESGQGAMARANELAMESTSCCEPALRLTV